MQDEINPSTTLRINTEGGMNAAECIKFGTDGWRGIIGDNYTFRNVRLVSQAVADYLGPGKKVAVGFDTRFMSERFAKVTSEVLANNGIEVILSDRYIPTPILSFTVKTRKLDLGIMITASHNPAEYNGFKIKDPSGGSAGPKLTKDIESRLGKTQVKQLSNAPVQIRELDLSSDYIKFIRSYIDFKKIKNKKFKVLVDVMYGAGNSFIAYILKGSNMKLEFMHNTINPAFGGIRPEPIEENLKDLKLRLKKEKFDLGITLDGDADRIAAFAPGGVFIHPQKILGLLVLHLNQDRHWSGGIVKTIAGSTMIDNIAKFLGVRLYETPVGFKYISDLMEKADIVAGGEEAGGMGVKGYIPERDGIVAGLLLLEMMVYRNKDILKILNETEKQFGRFYYLRKDIVLKAKASEPKKEDSPRPSYNLKDMLDKEGRGLPNELLGKKVVQVKDFDGIKLICEDGSWLMLRASGTEPIMRLYAESKSLKKSKQLLELGAKIINAY